jgi:hypothetical protein
MNINNNSLDSATPIKKQWKEPQIFLIAQNDVESKHLPYIKEGTGHYGPVGGGKSGTFFNGPGTKSTSGGGLHHKSLIS